MPASLGRLQRPLPAFASSSALGYSETPAAPTPAPRRAGWVMRPL